MVPHRELRMVTLPYCCLLETQSRVVSHQPMIHLCSSQTLMKPKWDGVAGNALRSKGSLHS